MLPLLPTHFKHLSLLTAVLLLTACATTPKTYSNIDTSIDFAQYKTYSFFAELATDRPGYESLESRFLKAAVSREMEQRGFSYADESDLQINFNINTKEKIYSRSTPSAGRYYGYRGSYYGAWGGYETRIDQYTEGTLNIDVIDAGMKKLVWEGAVIGRVNEEALDNLEATLSASVHVIFNEFPIARPAQ